MIQRTIDKLKHNYQFKSCKAFLLHNNFPLLSRNPTTPPVHTQYIAKGDSAASGHYIKQEHTHLLQNLQPSNNLHVYLPNNETISATPRLEPTDTPLEVPPSLPSTSTVSKHLLSALHKF